MSLSLDTSHFIVESFCPVEIGIISVTFFWAFSKAGSDMSVINTLAPSWMNWIVVSRPIPLSYFLLILQHEDIMSDLYLPSCSSDDGIFALKSSNHFVSQ